MAICTRLEACLLFVVVVDTVVVVAVDIVVDMSDGALAVG
jgi:hypothetical protein